MVTDVLNVAVRNIAGGGFHCLGRLSGRFFPMLGMPLLNFINLLCYVVLKCVVSSILAPVYKYPFGGSRRRGRESTET